ncbi:MAG: two-component system sensor histidine kinase NtrB [Candidatus Thorarchaeota archaeon]
MDQKRDVTHRYTDEGQFRKLSQAVENSPVTIMITDQEANIQYVNPAFSQITGYSPQTVIGKNVRILKTDRTPPETFEELSRSLESRKAWHGFFVNRKKNGEYFYEEAWVGPVFDENAEVIGYVAVKLDITELRRLQRIQEEQKRELEIFSSLMRHDLRNDLGVLVGNLELSRMLLKEEEGEIVELIDSSDAVIERMMKLLQSFGQLADNPETNPVTLLKDIAVLAEKADSNLKVDVEVEKGAGNLEISGSRLLPMVFDNIFRNAATHAGDNPTVKTRISRADNYVQISISDNGPGISEKVKGRLFQKGASTKGGGLGLYLSREIVKAMTGTIELAEPNEGEGATFVIRLPLILYPV